MILLIYKISFKASINSKTKKFIQIKSAGNLSKYKTDNNSAVMIKLNLLLLFLRNK